MNTQFQNVGPISYGVWKAASNDSGVEWEAEYPLITDAELSDSHDQEFGPYKLINMHISPSVDRWNPAIILRVTHHKVGNEYSFSFSITNDCRHHGGDIQDEIAALVSLCLGIKLKAGGHTRIFNNERDPKGTPVSPNGEFPMLLSTAPDAPIIPRALGPHTLNDASFLANYPNLTPEDAVALIKAARQYQDALWIAESQPALSWLMLVSAVEIVANQWKKSAKENALTRLKAEQPLIIKILQQGEDDVAQEVADLIIDTMGATKKFVDFLIEFLPPAPDPRPKHKDYVCSWDKEYMAKYLRKIYKHRSRALHDGVPFPTPMCNYPGRVDTETFAKYKGQPIRGNQPLQERPGGLGQGSVNGNFWLSEDVPMLLCTFEYIVRHSLLNWWAYTSSNAK